MKKKYNEYDENYAEQYHRQQLNKKKARRLKRFKKIALLLLIVVFLLSPLSRFNSVKIKGNTFTSTEMIQKKSGIKSSGFFFTKIPFFIIPKIEELPNIESVSIKHQWMFGIEIHVVERFPIAYGQTSKGKFFLDFKGNVIYYENEEWTFKFAKLPLIVGIEDEDKLSEIAIGLSKAPDSVVSQISEVRELNDKFDPKRILLLMNDRRQVYIRSTQLATKLENYNAAVTSNPEACIFEFDIGKDINSKACE